MVLDSSLHDCYGEFDQEKLEIRVSTQTAAKPKLLKETVRHEIFHACLFLSGLSFALPDVLEEQVVRMGDGILWDAVNEAEKSRRAYARASKIS